MASTSIKLARDALIQEEGFRPSVYQDQNGIDHIGYGFNLEALQLTEYEARGILVRLINEISHELASKYDWFETMPAPIKAVIVQMTYQMGVSGFDQFQETIRHFQAHDWKAAAAEMRNSEWCRTQTPARAERLARCVESLPELFGQLIGD